MIQTYTIEVSLLKPKIYELLGGIKSQAKRVKRGWFASC